MVKRIAFEIIVSKRNFNRLASQTHTPVEVLRAEGFTVRGAVFEADWPVIAAGDNGKPILLPPEELCEGDEVLYMKRVYKRGDRPEVLVSDRAGWIAIDRIGFLSGGSRGPLFFPRSQLTCFGTSGPDEFRAAWNGTKRKPLMDVVAA